MSKIGELIVRAKQIDRSIDIESYARQDWIKIKFGKDRHRFLKHRKEFKELFEEFDMKFELNIGWSWTPTVFEDLTFNNPTSTYEYFGPSNKSNPDFEVSDTTDPLYEISLFELRDVINRKSNDEWIEFKNYKRTLYGFYIDFSSKTTAFRFDNIDNFVDRSYSWEKTIDDFSKKTLYRYHLYMNDKKDQCQHVKLSSILEVIPREKKIIVLSSDTQLDELYVKIKSGEISLEEFKELKLN